MNIRFKGTVKQRTRIKLLFFWIVGKWETHQFDLSIPVKDQTTAWSSSVWGREVQLVGKLEGSKLIAKAVYGGVKLWDGELLKIGGYSQYVHAEPLKGVVLDGVVSVEA